MITRRDDRWGATAVNFSGWVSMVPVACLMLAAFSSTWALIKFPTGTPADIFLGLCLLSAGLMVAFGNLRFATPLWLWVPALAVLSCVLVRQLDPPPYHWRVLRFQVTYYKPESFVKAIFWLFALIVVPLAIVACIAITRRAATWTMGTYAAGVTVSAIVAVSDFVGLTAISGGLGYDSIHARAVGLTDHPNTLAFTCVLAIPILVYFISSWHIRWLPLMALIILLAAVVASGSRGAQLMAPIALFASVLCTPNRKSTAQVVGSSVGLLSLVGLAYFLTIGTATWSEIFRFDSNGASTVSSTNDRMVLLKTAFGDWQRYPLFGAGIRHIVEAHNIVLQILAAGGVVLFAGMAVYFVWMFVDARALIRSGDIFARYLTVSIAAWLSLGIIENQLTDRLYYYVVGCLAGLVVATRMSGDAGRAAGADPGLSRDAEIVDVSWWGSVAAGRG